MLQQQADAKENGTSSEENGTISAPVPHVEEIDPDIAALLSVSADGPQTQYQLPQEFTLA
jgi:hypothetical protein